MRERGAVALGRQAGDREVLPRLDAGCVALEHPDPDRTRRPARSRSGRGPPRAAGRSPPPSIRGRRSRAARSPGRTRAAQRPPPCAPAARRPSTRTTWRGPRRAARAYQPSTSNAPASRSRAVVTPSCAWSRLPATVCAWLCRSIQPGATTAPRASCTLVPRSSSLVTAEIRPFVMATLATASRPVSGSTDPTTDQGQVALARPGAGHDSAPVGNRPAAEPARHPMRGRPRSPTRRWRASPTPPPRPASGRSPGRRRPPGGAPPRTRAARRSPPAGRSSRRTSGSESGR